MRVGATWGDVCILNISTRGLLIHAAKPPPRGTYLDVHRGHYAMVARVVWAGDNRFGVCTQDPLPVEAIIRQPDASAVEAACSGAPSPVAERRRQAGAKAQARHESSRMLSRSMEFGIIALFAATAAVGAYSAVSEALWRPLGELSSAISPRSP